MRSGAYRRVAVAAGSLGLLVLTGGLLHLPVARPLLARLSALCPVETNPALVEPLQREALRQLRGGSRAPSHDTVPLHLLQSSASAIETWARQQGLICEAADGAYHSLTCAGVPADALGRQIGSAAMRYQLVISMSMSGRPVAVSLLARHLDAPQGAAALAAVRQELDGALGAATQASGVITPAALAQPFHGVSAEYRFSDRVVRIGATNIPASGVVVRELYLTSDGA